MSTIDLSKFRSLLTKIEKMGFDEMFQAGTVSRSHELNLILQDNTKDLQIWVSKSFGKFLVIYRNGINNSANKQYKFPCGTQKQIIETINNIRENLCQSVS